MGLGSLVELATRDRLPGALLPLAGLAAMIVVARAFTAWSVTAPLAAPAIVAAAIVGLGLATPWRGRIFEPWTLAAALGVYALYAAPVVLSGEDGFAGYIKLDDTATWFAITDRVIEDGLDLSGLAPSSYEATLDEYVGKGYPTGANLPLGVGRELVGEDVAWVFQPYLAYLAALLALGFSELVRPLVAAQRPRAVVALLAPLAALLYGYTMWGGLKELTVAVLLVGLAAFAAGLLDAGREGRFEPRRLLPAALAAAAVLAVLSPGGAVWVLPALIPVAVALYRSAGAAGALRPAAWFAGAVALLSLPLVAVGKLLPPVENALDAKDALINLFEPLSPLQLFGVWPAEDFRLRPDDELTAYALVAVVAGFAVLGLVLAWRARAWALLLYVAGALGGCLVVVVAGSPWIDSKAMATGAPAIPLLALAAAAAVAASGRRVEGYLALAAIAAGLLWSTALAYRGVNLAPHDQLAELERIGERVAGEGPTLMTEYQPYGVRHFLRDADPEGVSELRRRTIPLRDGTTVEKGRSADTDELRLEDLLVYRTLVLRRSPSQSRPPAPYRLLERGEYYETWQRDPAIPDLTEHLPLGGEVDPGAVPDCAEVARLAGLAGAGGALAAAPSAEPIAVAIEQPTTVRVRVPAAGAYEVWLGGSVRGEMRVLVDGVERGSARGRLNHSGGYVALATVELETGEHEIELAYGGADLHPGSGGRESPIGPLVLRPQPRDSVVSVAAGEATAELCGRRWDWIEILVAERE